MPGLALQIPVHIIRVGGAGGGGWRVLGGVPAPHAGCLASGVVHVHVWASPPSPFRSQKPARLESSKNAKNAMKRRDKIERHKVGRVSPRPPCGWFGTKCGAMRRSRPTCVADTDGAMRTSPPTVWILSLIILFS